MAINPNETWDALKKNVHKAISSFFPYENKFRKLELHNIEIDDKLSPNDIKSQEAAKLKGRTWGIPVYGDISLIDKETGKTIDRKKIKLLTLPKLTPRYGYIVGGHEWQPGYLWKLKSGVYATIRDNGVLNAEFNLAKPFARENRINVPFDPESRKLNLNYATSNVPLYSVLKTLGVSDAEMKKAWGEDIYKANVSKNPEKDVLKLYSKIAQRGYKVPGADADPKKAAEAVRRAFFDTGLLPDTTKRALGKGFKFVDGDALLRASKRVISIARGESKPEDRNSLVFKELVGTEDFLHDILQRPSVTRKIKSKIENNIMNKNEVDKIVLRDLFNRPVNEFFTKSDMSALNMQLNPLDMLSGSTHTTIKSSEGGIKNDKAIRTNMKLVNQSHMGFLDPIHTPESEETGITLYLPQGVKKEGREAKVIAYDLKKRKPVKLTPAELHSEKVVLPDQVSWTAKGPVALGKTVKVKDPEDGEILEDKLSSARYVLMSPQGLFDSSSNLIPFLHNDQGNRSMMAAKQMNQAVPLAHREEPLVQTAATGSKIGRTWEKVIGKVFSAHSPVNGKVVRLEKDEIGNVDRIVIRDAKTKKLHKVDIYNHFPLNDNRSFLHNEPRVSVGDEVKEGQLLADSNFTKNGTLSMGTNLHVAYIPYKGYNFEDGIVISESAAKKLSSAHMYKMSHNLDPKTDTMSRSKLISYAAVNPTAKITKEQAAKLDKDGVIRPGAVVEPGDVLIAAVGKQDISGQRAVLNAKLKGVISPIKNKSLIWDKDHKGKVVKVVRHPAGKGATIYVKTVEPAQIGDKIIGRHGNKGIITRILKDEDMPRVGGPDGKPIEVALNPSGVVSRINVGQLLETAVSKAAEKKNMPFVVKNFPTSKVDSAHLVKTILKKEGISDVDSVYDPETKKKLSDKVLTGKQYILKLHHQVEKKLSARSYGPNYTLDQVPASGGHTSGQSMDQYGFYTLLAHGADSNIREMATYKAEQQLDKNRAETDFWDRIMTNRPLPPPRPTFAYRKFENMLRAAGINIRKDGHKLQLTPLTDEGIKRISGGAIKDGRLALRGKDATELKGGLFDPKTTGGLPNAPGKGLKWAHFDLAEPVPNPAFLPSGTYLGPIAALTDLSAKDIDDIMTGKKKLNGKYGGAALKDALSKINVDEELKKVKEELPKLKGSALDKAMRKRKYLEALKGLKMRPDEAYILTKLPIIPPVFRPIVPLPNGNLRVDDINLLYRNVAHLNAQLKDLPKELPDEEKNPLRAQLYDAVKATWGLGGKPVYDSDRKVRGILDLITGDKPKNSYFQSKIMSRRQDMSMRSTIIPEPAMSLDEVGIPRDAALTLYKPFIIRNLVTKFGYTPLRARKALKEGEPIVDRALKMATEERPILLKRDPALHKFSVQAFKPKIVEGKAIQIHPLVTGGYNADFDGDSCVGKILLYNLEEKCYGDKVTKGENTMAHIGKLPTVIEIEDFPRVKGTASITPRGTIEYDVPKGTYVLAYKDGKIQIMPVTKFSIHPNCEEWITEFESGRELTTSEDHSLAVLDPETLEIVKRAPRESIGLCCPSVRGYDDHTFESLPGHRINHGNARQMMEEVPLNFDFGWFIGACVGDGWVSDAKVNLASGVKDAAVKEKWKKMAALATNNAAQHDRANPHTFEGSECCSVKTVVSSTALSRFLEPMIGKKAQNKHLPENFIQMPLEFRRGLLCGLIDTDGSIKWSNGRFSMQYTTTSKRLMEEIIFLGLSLGLPSSATEYKNGDKPAWVITFSVRPVQEATWIKVQSPHKAVALKELQAGLPKDYGRNDVVPITNKAREELLSILRDLGATKKKDRNREAFSQYVVLGKGNPTITRTSVHKLWSLVSNRSVSDYLRKWFDIALNDKMGWDLVVDSKPTGNKIEMYDITVPDSWTFVMANGLVVWDTMSGFVPVTEEARKEAFKMLPSRNIYSPTSGKVMHAPTQESLLGLYLASKWGDKKELKKTAALVQRRSFRNLQEARSAYNKGIIDYQTPITVAGRQTTLGRLEIMDALPAHMRNDPNLLHNPAFVINKSNLQKIIKELAKTSHPTDYAQTMDKLKDIGNKISYEKGFSFSLDDLEVPKRERDAILKKYDAAAALIKKSKKPKEEKDEELVALYTKATQDLNKLKPLLSAKGNRLYEMAEEAKARGNWGQVRQMLVAPMLMVDANGRPLPTPVKRSYSEGLDVGDYWTSLHGARKGTIGRVEETSKPGALSKDVINLTLPDRIMAKDCGTTDGVFLSLQNRDVMDRLLAKPIVVAGKTIPAKTIVTPDLYSFLRKNKITKVLVRSPLKCKLPKGVCAACYGLASEGKLFDVGTNIGVIAGQAIGEPSTQLSMNAFHSGGVAGGAGAESTDSFTRLSQLLKMQKRLPGAATLSKTSGTVQSVQKDLASGGWRVMIGGKSHYVPIKNKLRVTKGSKVKKGEPISTGPVDPHQLLKLTNINTVQNYLTSELEKLYSGAGVKRRNIEVVVRSLTNLAKVKDPADSHYSPGEVVKRSVLDDYNRKLKPGSKPIKYTPVLKGVGRTALEQHDDWMARLNYQYLKSTILEGAAQGWETNVGGMDHGAHPVPSYAYGVHFGKKK